MNMTTVPRRRSWHTVKDKHTKTSAGGAYFPGVHGSVPPLADIPPGVVSARLYG
jgi:hypothetical protein